MEEGFLKLSRKFFSNELWKEARKFSECEAWLDLLQSARFDATDTARSELIGGREISYTRGQYPASISFLVKRWQWSEKKVRCFLEKLKKREMITVCNKQGMNVITICKYDEYNSPKNRPERKPCGIDNQLDVKELYDALDRLRAEMRANTRKTGQDGGNKKKKDKEEEKNTIPPIPPKGESLNAKARAVFENHFRETFGSDYYWTAKDAGSMTRLLDKLLFLRKQKEMPVDDPSLLHALQVFLTTIREGWIYQNFSVPNINSKFNEIISQARNGKNNEKDNDQHSGTESAGIKIFSF